MLERQFKDLQPSEIGPIHLILDQQVQLRSRISLEP